MFSLIYVEMSNNSASERSARNIKSSFMSRFFFLIKIAPLMAKFDVCVRHNRIFALTAPLRTALRFKQP